MKEFLNDRYFTEVPYGKGERERERKSEREKEKIANFAGYYIISLLGRFELTN
jgi:hypothetical protein